MSYSVTGSASNDSISGYMGTTGAETATICSITVPENCVAKGKIEILAQKDNDTEVIIIEKAFGAQRGTGEANLVGSLENIIPDIKDLELITSNVSLSINDDLIELKGTGVLTKSINWYGKISLTSVVFD